MYNDVKECLQNELAKKIANDKAFSWKSVLMALELCGLGM